MEQKGKSSLKPEDLENVTGGKLDDVPPVDEHDYDDEVKDKIK